MISICIVCSGMCVLAGNGSSARRYPNCPDAYGCAKATYENLHWLSNGYRPVLCQTSVCDNYMHPLSFKMTLVGPGLRTLIIYIYIYTVYDYDNMGSSLQGPTATERNILSAKFIRACEEVNTLASACQTYGLASKCLRCRLPQDILRESLADSPHRDRLLRMERSGRKTACWGISQSCCSGSTAAATRTGKPPCT